MTHDRARRTRGTGRSRALPRAFGLVALLAAGFVGLVLAWGACDGSSGDDGAAHLEVARDARAAAPRADLGPDEGPASPRPTTLEPVVVDADAPDPDAPLGRDEEGAVLVGRVTDADGRALMDARVLLVPSTVAEGRPGADDDAPASVATSDEHGAYRLRLLRRAAPSWSLAGGYLSVLIVVEAEGHARAFRVVAWTGDRETAVGDVRLEPAVRVRGRVVDSLGVELAGVEVCARAPAPGTARAAPALGAVLDVGPAFERWIARRATTRSERYGALRDGRCVFDDLDPGTYRVYVARPESGERVWVRLRSAPVGPGETVEVEVELQPGG